MINSKVYGLIGLAMRAGKIAFGADAVEDLIKKRKLKLVIVAENSSERTRNNFEFICNKNNIPIIIFGDIENISKFIGKQNKAIIGVKEANIANEICKIVNGGEIIG